MKASIRRAEVSYACAAARAAAIAAALSIVVSCSSAAARSGEANAPAKLEPTGADALPGKVYGEFEDAALLKSGVASRPEMASWSEKEICDGLSGATIQAKTYGRPVPDRLVMSGRTILAYADGFGQYWLELPPGTHELVGRCKGYRDAKATVTVAPGSVQYCNFYLEPR